MASAFARARMVTVPGRGDVPPETFRLVVDGTAAPFVLIDRVGTIRYASGSTSQVLGWGLDDFVGHNIVEFLPGHQVDTAIGAVAEIEAGDRTGAGVPIVFAVNRPDGGCT